ncbi:MAG: hypothetical protein ACRCYU_16025, partial [Nocardioides sp.]
MTDTAELRARTRAQAWVAHLRSGGTTPWLDYDLGASGLAESDEAIGAGGERLPGAQQLELLRRINSANRPTAVRPGEQAGGDRILGGASRSRSPELVLRASLTGRGQPEAGLSGLAGPRPAVDPASLPASELLRVAVSAIADSLVVGGLPEPVEWPPRRRRHRPFQLVGNPWLTIPIRHELALAGHPPGGPRSRAFVLGGPFDQL